MPLRERLTHRRLPWIAAAIAVALCLPSLWAGFIGDDYYLRAILQDASPVMGDANPLLDMYRLAPADEMERAIREGYFPWWSDPQLNIGFMRPLAAATHVLDLALWPDNAALQHLHSLIWFGLAVFLVALLYRRIHGGVALAGLAALLFAVEDAHYMPAGWLANRNAVLTLVGGMSCLLAHIRWRETGRWRWLAVALAAIVAGLLAGEAALGALAYLFAWQMTLDRAAWRGRLLALLPYGAVVVAWRLVYDAMGYGTTGCGLYVDPGAQPLEFALALLQRWPALMFSQWSQCTADIWPVLDGRTAWIVSFLAYGALGGLAWLMRGVLRESPQARFWALGMALSLIPLCAAFPMTRLLLYAGIGAFGLLATMAQYAGWIGSAPGQGGRLVRVSSGLLLLLHGPLAAAALLFGAATLPTFGALFTLGADTAPADEGLADQTLIFVNGNEFPVFYLQLFRTVDEGAPCPRRTALLSTMNTANRVTREDAHTLVVHADGGLFQMGFDRLMRGEEPPFGVGEVIETVDYTVELRAVTPDGRPERIAFTFREPLESPSYRWVVFRPDGLEAFDVPQVGETVVVPMAPLLEVVFDHLSQ